MQRFWELVNTYPASFWLGIAVCLITAAFLFFLISASRHIHQRRVLYSFLGILIISWGVHIYLLSQIEPACSRSWYSIISLSLISSFKLFIGDSHIFDNGFQDFLFKPANAIWLLVMSSLYLFAICTSCYLVVNLFFKRFSSKLWLFSHRPQKNNFIFFGLDQNTLLLAKNILTSIPEKKQVIIVSDSASNDIDFDTSIFERLHTISSERNDTLSRAQLRQATILKSRKRGTSAQEKDFFSALGLPRLSRWFYNGNNTQVFILSEHEEENMELLEALLSRNVRFGVLYCHTSSHRGSLVTLEEYYRRKYQSYVKFIDSAHLSIQSLLKDECYFPFQPIHFVDIAKDKELNLGYVISPFTSLIVGFGEFGQSAARYLYEYGAFVGKDFCRSPFLCHVCDPKNDNLFIHFALQHPGIEMSRHFNFHKMEAGSSSFWSVFGKIAPTLRYVFLCTEDDGRNLSLAEEMLAMLPEPEKVGVLARQSRPSASLVSRSKIIKEHFSQSFSTFGEQDSIWTYNNISDVMLDKEAKAFYESYSLCAGDKPDWEGRQKRIRLGNPKSIRQQSQDYANVLHRHTKLTLIGDNKTVRQTLEGGINSGKEYFKHKKHYSGEQATQYEYLELLGRYLAVGEHIRWHASHVIMGYVYGTDTDDMAKKHACMLPYDTLPDSVRHYDWLVIKTTLLLASEGGNPATIDTEISKEETYVPSPMDVEDICISPQLEELGEKLAKNVHDVWAQSRIQNGWRYGPNRDDVAKLHPDLVPYDRLPEQEKEYDRATSIHTIKMILKLGFKISKDDA